MHTNRLAAAAALASLRTAYAWLDDLADATVHVPTHHAPATDTQRAARDRRAATARVERLTMGAGAGTTPAPLRPEVADARVAALRAVTDCAWLCSSALRTAEGAPRYLGAWTGPPGAGGRWDITTGYLADAIPHITPELARTVARDLERADRTVRRAVGEAPDHRPVHAPCPACGRRGTLHAEVSDPDRDRWSVTCHNVGCTCRGIDCACKLPDRPPGRRHVWPAAAFPTLGDILGAAT